MCIIILAPILAIGIVVASIKIAKWNSDIYRDDHNIWG
jgi:hypothetical protein